MKSAEKWRLQKMWTCWFSLFSLISVVVAPRSCSGKTASAIRLAPTGPLQQGREAPHWLPTALQASSTESWPNPGGRAALIFLISPALAGTPVPWTPPSSQTRSEVRSVSSYSSVCAWPQTLSLKQNHKSQGSGPGCCGDLACGHNGTLKLLINVLVQIQKLMRDGHQSLRA